MIIYATTQSIRYEKGDYYIQNGARGGNKSFFKNDYYHKYSFGYDHAYKPSKLIVEVEIEDSTYEVWVDFFFKNRIGRLTLSRIDRITSTLPAVIPVEKMTGFNGSTYYRLYEDDDIMKQWLAAVDAAA